MPAAKRHSIHGASEVVTPMPSVASASSSTPPRSAARCGIDTAMQASAPSM